MRYRYRIKEKLQFLAFAFYPKITLLACVSFSAIVIAILGIVMTKIPKESAWYSIVFALTTGAAGSFFVTIVVELTNNYRHNKLAWYELQEYYAAIMNYESHKQILMQRTPHQRAKRKAHEEFVATGGVEEYNEYDNPKDYIQAIWKQIPKLIPIINQAFEYKKAFLSEEEISRLQYILSDYREIRSVIQIRIMKSPMTYDALNHPDGEYLYSIYPADVIRNMPEWVKNHLASEESQKACDRYADAILADEYLLSEFMKEYDISQRGMDSYQAEIDKRVEEEYIPEDIDYDELDYSQLEDEEAFRARIEAFDKQTEINNRSFVSWHISKCCQSISESLDILEKSVQKKPYYGMMIRYFRNSSKKSSDDVMSTKIYESEKSHLDKRLARQQI